MRRTAAFIALISSTTLMPAVLHAQSSPSAYTSGVRYDAARRVVGTIAPDPDGSGSLKYAAMRNSYDAAGRLVKVEKGELSSWQAETVLPSAWGSAFTISQTQDISYDAVDRKASDKLTAGSTVLTLSQYSYDSVGRAECTAVRMNTAAFGSAPSSACSLGTEGSVGPDRVVKNVYNLRGELTKVQKAFGTSLQQDEATYAYSDNGKKTSITDARSYMASMTYDGFDRQQRWNMPSKTTTATVDTNDYEEYAYDDAGNRTGTRKRDGKIICQRFDVAGRADAKFYPTSGTAGACSTTTPSGTDSVWYAYDNRGLQLSARLGSSTGNGVVNVYDKAGRLTSSAGKLGTFSSLYDENGNRTRITHPDSFYAVYAYDGLNRPATISENGTTTLVTMAYDTLGRRSSLTRANGANTAYTYDGASRLATLGQDLASTTNDLTLTFGWNPASQMSSRDRSNSAYILAVNAGTETFAVNGQNQLTSAAGATISYDANGNLTSDGSTTFSYDVENRLTGATGAKSATLVYDTMGRLEQLTTASTTALYGYDGANRLTEAPTTTGAVTRRYIFGAGEDEALVWYEGSGLTDRRFLHADHQGSIIAVTNSTGAASTINKYDEYGIPASTNAGAFQYTGQVWLPTLGLYHYKARAYSPTWGRFLQTDPVGYDDQINLFAYVGNDPVDGRDPSGLCFENHCPVGSGNAHADELTRNAEQGLDANGHSYLNPAPGVTVGIGGTMSATGARLSGAVTVGQMADNTGKSSGYVDRAGSGGRATAAGRGANVGVTVYLANGHVADQRGRFNTASAQAGPVSVTAVQGSNSNGQQVYGVALTVGAGAGTSGGVGRSNTTLIPTPKTPMKMPDVKPAKACNRDMCM